MDCGFLAQALLRAPNELWKKLDSATQKNLAAGFLLCARDHAGTKQLAAFRGDGGGGAGDDGRAV